MFISADVSVINQAWLVGDITLAKGIAPLQKMKTEVMNGGENLYLHENFDVFTFYSVLADRLNRAGGNPLIRMYNAFIEGINKYSKLPKYVIVIFDSSFIREVDSKKEIEQLLLWLIKEYMKIIEICKDKLPKKAVATDGPKLPVTKHLDQTDQFKTKRRIFNKAFDDSLQN